MFNRKYVIPSLILLPMVIVIIIANSQNDNDTLSITERSKPINLVRTENTVINAEEYNSVTLEGKLNEIVNDEQLDGAITGISVRKADTGEEIYNNLGDIRLHPASNMKILTVVAALDILGPDYQFLTEVLTDGEIKANKLEGNLYLKGKGDPTLLKEDLDMLAIDLKELGIEIVEGALIGDDSWYDNIRLSQDLNWSDEPFYTGAQVSALTLSPNSDYDAGTVIVEIFPGNKIGEGAKVNVTPETDYVTIINNTEMVGADGVRDISAIREHGTNNIIVEGTMPLGGDMDRSWASVWEPTEYVLDVFRQSLERNGITISEGVKTGVSPEHTKLLTARKSMPLKDLIIPFMKLSNNGHGEILTKEMGKVIHGEGSWDKGLDVIQDVVTTLGIDPDKILLRDGSGMSHKNYIPASELTQLLYVTQEKGWYPVFEKSLPVAGKTDRLIGGTLRYRLTSEPTVGNVMAKTGTLTGVLTLSGYVMGVNGEKLIFSILNNNYLIDDSKIASIQDEIVTILATHAFE